MHVSALLARLARAVVGNGGSGDDINEAGGEKEPPPPAPVRWALLRRLLAASAARLGDSGPRQLSASLWALARLLKAQEGAAAVEVEGGGQDLQRPSASPSSSPSSSSSASSSPRPLAPSWYLSAWADAWRQQGQAKASGRDAAEALAALAALRVPLRAMAAADEQQQQQQQWRQRTRQQQQEASPAHVGGARGRFLTSEQAHALARDLPSALHRAAAFSSSSPSDPSAAAVDAADNANAPAATAAALAPRDVAVALSAMAELGLRPSEELLGALCFCAQRWEGGGGGGAQNPGRHHHRRNGLGAFSPAEAAAVLTALARLRASPPDRSWVPELLARQAAAVAGQEGTPAPSARDWAQALAALARLRTAGAAAASSLSPPLPPASWLSPCLDALGAEAHAHARALRRRRERAAARQSSSASSPSPSLARSLACAGLALASLRVRPTDAWMRAYEAAATEEAMLSVQHPSPHEQPQRIRHLACMASAMARLRHRPSPRFASALLRATAAQEGGSSLDRCLSLPALSALGCAVAELCRGGRIGEEPGVARPKHRHHHAQGSAAAGTPRRRRELRSWLRRWQRAVAAAAVDGSASAPQPRLGARLLWAADEMTRHSGAAGMMGEGEEEEEEVTEEEEEVEEEEAGGARRRRSCRHRRHHSHSRSPSGPPASSYPSARWAASLCRACGLLPPLPPPSAAMGREEEHGGGGTRSAARALEAAALSPAETARLATALAGLMANDALTTTATTQDRAATRDLVPLLEACLRSLARRAARGAGGGGSAPAAAAPGAATRAQLARCARAVAALPASAQPPAAVLEAFCAAAAEAGTAAANGDDSAARRDALRRALGALLGCGVGGLAPDGGSGRALYDARTGSCVIVGA
jgi:hypothetical protein